MKLRVILTAIGLNVLLSLVARGSALAAGSCPPASSVGGSVVVNARNADITINSNGTVDYVETWVVNFQGSGFTFAFRDIPLNKTTGISSWGVTENGLSYQNSSTGENVYSLRETSESSRITWCFSPTTNKIRTFELRYTVQGSIAIYDDLDRYFWKFIESDRGYTILSSHVQVHLPGSFAAENLKFTGSDHRILNGSTVEFQGGPFISGDEWEIGVRFPHGTLTSSAPDWQAADDNAGFYSLLIVAAAAVILILSVMAVYLIWYTFGRDKPIGVRAKFIPRPPSDIPPGIVGILLDERADMEDILATVVDLSRRGFMEITETNQPSFTKRADFEFKRLEGGQGTLLAYEERLLYALFGSRKSKKLSNLKNKFYSALPEIKKLMYQEVTRQKYFPTNPEKVRSSYTCGGIAGLIIFGFVGFILFSWLAEYSFAAICLAASIVVFPLGIAIVGRVMPRKTHHGAKQAAIWNSFKNYLKDIEKYSKLKGATDQFEKYLPYAIAFGLERRFVRQFSQVDTPIPTWYHMYPTAQPLPHRAGSRGRGVTRPRGQSSGSGGSLPTLDQASGQVFAGLGSMSDGLFSMLDSASSIFTSAPQSSGGGGGFSGGGGGGGGGSSGFG